MVDRGSFSRMNSDLSFVDEKVRRFVPFRKMSPLPFGFQPSNWSVICGKGKHSFNHVGNRRFRLLCELHLGKYEKAQTRFEKSVIVMSIVDAVREGCRIGGFVKKDTMTQQWHEVGDAVAREKVGQQLREILSKKDSNRALSQDTSSRKRRCSEDSSRSDESTVLSSSSSSCGDETSCKRSKPNEHAPPALITTTSKNIDGNVSGVEDDTAALDRDNVHMPALARQVTPTSTFPPLMDLALGFKEFDVPGVGLDLVAPVTKDIFKEE